MNIGKIAERSMSKIIKKDVFGKETYPGDIVMYPSSASSFQYGIIEKFTPQGISVIIRGKPYAKEFFYNKDFLNITNRLEKAEIEEFEELKKIFYAKIKQYKEEKISSKYVFTIVYDNENPKKWGFAYFRLDSRPGKSITIAELKQFQDSVFKITNAYSKVEFFSKYFELTSKWSDNVICSKNNYQIREYMITPNKVYWASPYTNNIFNERKCILFEASLKIETFKNIFNCGYYAKRDAACNDFCSYLDEKFLKRF